MALSINPSLISGVGTQLEPFRAYSFLLEIEGLSDITLAVQSTQMPQNNFDEIELGWVNGYVYFPGKSRHEPMPLVLRDLVAYDTAARIAQWWKQHYDPETGIQYPASNYKRTAYLMRIAPGSDQGQEAWELRGLFLLNSNFGQLDFSNSAHKELDLTLRFDVAIPRHSGVTSNALGVSASLGGSFSATLGNLT